MDNEAEHHADGVDDDMTLSSLDPLAGVITANLARLRGFYALAVDHARRRLRLAACQSGEAAA